MRTALCGGHLHDRLLPSAMEKRVSSGKGSVSGRDRDLN
jgi:hypothetical protein